jgi:hypothetical protein
MTTVNSEAEFAPFHQSLYKLLVREANMGFAPESHKPSEVSEV